jgi:hypothetical protein
LAAPFSGGYVTLVGGLAQYSFTVPQVDGEFSFTGVVSSDTKIVPPIQGDKVTVNAVVKAVNTGPIPLLVTLFGADEVDAATAAVSQLATTIATLAAIIVDDLKAFSDAMSKL